MNSVTLKLGICRFAVGIATCLGLNFIAYQVKGNDSLALVEVRKIWDRAPHNAFTDLTRVGDRWFCVFREGTGHVSPDGALRVITSTDSVHWESAALIQSPTSDLRDAKISIMPDGRLMLAGAEALQDRSKKTHQSLAWFSPDGVHWSERHQVGDPNFWLWRVTWSGTRAYGLGYGCNSDNRFVRLYSSQDGVSFTTLVDRLVDEGYPNESSIVFDGDTAYCLLRRDDLPRSDPPSEEPKLSRNITDGLLGIAKPPYQEWSWHSVGTKIGGPHMILLPDGRLLAAVRLYGSPVRTSLCWIDRESGKLTEALRLPSGGDTSYAGLVWSDDYLWVSYYSSHEGKTNIYLAKVAIL